MSAIQKLLEEKNWNISQLAVAYGKAESPGISDEEAIKKYGSIMRKVVKNPEDTKHKIVQKVVEILGGRLVVKIDRTDELPL
ncbi:hypothetical protein [Calothrix sp. 336/3]